MQAEEKENAYKVDKWNSQAGEMEIDYKAEKWKSRIEIRSAGEQKKKSDETDNRERINHHSNNA